MGEAPHFLRNSYWILRHGKSIPNEKGLIVSSMENGTLEEFGLAPDGIQQAKLAGIQCKAMAELRERFFGPKFEILSHDKYTEIWALDEKDPFTSPEGGESVEGVVFRLGIALAALEAEYEGCSILLVSHGDPLQILQAVLGAAKESSLEEDVSSRIKQVTNRSVLSHHRKFALLTAELRRIE